MSTLRRLTATAAFGVLIAAGAVAQDGPAPETADADTVVATVNGTEITLGHMAALRERLPDEYRELPAPTLFDGILEQLTQQQALADQAGAPTRRIELVLDNERRALQAADVIADAAQGAVTDAALQAAYDETFAEMASETEWNASHILVETEEEAQEIVTALEEGGDFAELARERSTGPSGPGGGELGWFGPGMMVAPFEEAVAGMDAGVISAPVQTQFGWHVLRLNDTRQKEAPSFGEMREELGVQVRQAAVEQAIADASAGADVSTSGAEGIDPEVLNDPALLSR